MKSLVWRGMADGAVGFSTGLQYVPGTYAQTSEIIELARVAGNDGGVYASHMRNEGTALEEAVAETIRVGEIERLPRADLSPEGRQPQPLGRQREGARAHRRRARSAASIVEADQYAYTAASSTLGIRFPSWALEGGQPQINARLERRPDLGEDQDRDAARCSPSAASPICPSPSSRPIARIRRSTACR